ncbi:MAG TPA: lysophospholipid acyltransferase family protein [Vicinamibacterales bacterium]|nr:lysophospholipid acyltransferase family protein [Vicinamibacterales bacterium]
MTDASIPAGGAAAPAWRRSWRKRAQAALIAGLGTPMLRVLCATWRIEVVGAEHLAACAPGGPPFVLATWHGRILPSVWFWRGRGMVVVISENFDGEWIARIVSRFGYGTARGSTSRGGARALRQLVRAARLAPTAFTVDGPRGPAGVVQPGAVWLARATGQPVVPFHAEAARHWTLRSWDRTQIPKPFTRVVMAVGAPLIVAANGDLDAARHTLELRLQDTARACQQVLASRVPA